MVAQQAAAQQAARCFLALLQDVQSSPPAHTMSFPGSGRKKTAFTHPEMRTQKAALGSSSFESEDTPISEEMPLNPRCKVSAEDAALFSEFGSFSSVSVGLPQHSMGNRPVSLLE